MAERIRSRGPEGAGGWLESACKLILAARAGVLLLTLVSLTGEDDRDLVAVLLVVAAAASFIPLRWWERVGPALVRHPAYLAAELMLAALILLLTPVQSPFFYFTLGTALLGGLLYGYSGAAVFSLLLVAVYLWSLDVRSEVDEIPETFQTYVGLPALYPLVAAAGAAARRLLDRQAEAESELAEEQGRAAAEAERARLARDMHDSLAKTVSGIGFAALALSRRIERDPRSAADEARRLAEDARQATREAREIIVGLRADAGEALPLSSALATRAQGWAEETGVQLSLAIEEVGELHPQTARELEWILAEALANCRRHARARRVGVRLRRLGARAVLTVVDDGVGFEVPDELEELAGGRHFGVGGMRERALLAGGDLSIESSPGDGCVLSVWVPTEVVPKESHVAEGEREERASRLAGETGVPERGNVAEDEREERASRLAGETDQPARSVPGYTWQ
jgi:signal transduction histidine kinase